MHRLLALVAGLALAACETSPQPAPTSTSAASDPHEERAPLLLSLQAVADEGGVLQLQAHLDAQAGLPLPVELTVALPPGATLLDGDARQSVSVAAGRTTRTFRISHGDLSTPVKVTAHVEHPKRAWGVHAEKSYPEATPKPGNTARAVPPAARPPFAPAQRNEAH